MKVILTQDVKKLGKTGELVEVAEGYGRNYLIPKGLAEEATSGNVRRVEAEKKVEKDKRRRELEAAQETAKRLDGQKLQITAKVGDAGKLFGSITAAEIADRLKKQYKVDVDKRKIVLKDPIKSLGTTDVTVKLHPKVHVTIHVQVTES